MGYYIVLKNISINKYKEILTSADLLPSRRVLKNNIETYFDIIKNQNISNVEELQKNLKTKKKLQEFSVKSGLKEDYLKILIREINSNHQKPNKIRDFPNIPEKIIVKLENYGIINTFQLFEKVLTSKSRKKLSEETGINENDILKLTKLTDLSRIRWVNHTFAFVLFEAGYDTTAKVANADYKELFDTIKDLNEKRKLYKGHIGLHDMKLTVKAAQKVELEIKY